MNKTPLSPAEQLKRDIALTRSDFDQLAAKVKLVKSAPVVCPACGGTLSKPVLRGMDTITCDFCGHIIKL